MQYVPMQSLRRTGNGLTAWTFDSHQPGSRSRDTAPSGHATSTPSAGATWTSSSIKSAHECQQRSRRLRVGTSTVSVSDPLTGPGNRLHVRAEGAAWSLRERYTWRPTARLADAVRSGNTPSSPPGRDVRSNALVVSKAMKRPVDPRDTRLGNSS